MIGEPGRTLLLDTCTVLDLAIAPSRVAATAMAEVSDLTSKPLGVHKCLSQSARPPSQIARIHARVMHQ